MHDALGLEVFKHFLAYLSVHWVDIGYLLKMLI